MLIESGENVHISDAGRCVAAYYERDKIHNGTANGRRRNRFLDIRNISVNGGQRYQIDHSSPFDVTVDLSGNDIRQATIFFIIENAFGQSVLHKKISSAAIGQTVIDGDFQIRIDLPSLWLTPGIYSMYFKIL